MSTLQLTVQSDYKRADVYLSEHTELTRSAIKKLMEDGNVTLNGQEIKPSSAVKQGDMIAVLVPPPVPLKAVPQDIPIDIVYEDDFLAVINKPQGLTVHPAVGNREGTLVNALMFKLKSLSSINGVIRPGIVHRIDKDTSGLLVVAKCDSAHVSLSAQIANKTCRRIYRAVTEGVIKQDSGIIDQSIGRSRTDRKKMAVVPGGRRAVTHYKVLERFAANTYAEFELKTGRTHQIRVHLKHIGHPIVGDPVYGYSKQKFNLNGQLLHAYKLMFTHPDTGKDMEFTCPLPDYFEKILQTLKKTLY